MLEKKLRLHRKTIQYRVRLAVERGYLINKEDKVGTRRPMRLVLGDPMPTKKVDTMPTLGQLESAWRKADPSTRRRDNQDDD